MFLKLHNPVTDAVHIFEFSNEARIEASAGTDAQIRAHQENLEKDTSHQYSNDVRRFMIHQRSEIDSTSYQYADIYIAAIDRGGDPREHLCVLTNWNVYLMNDAGQTIDRLFASMFGTAVEAITA